MVFYLSVFPNVYEWGYGLGSYEGVAKTAVRMQPSYLASEMGPSPYERPTAIKVDLAGSEAGPGGYDRVSMTFDIIDHYDQTPIRGCVIIMKIQLDVNIRTMELPQTTDFRFELHPDYIANPQMTLLFERETLVIAQRRSYNGAYLLSGVYASPTKYSGHRIRCVMSWRDKTGVPPDRGYYNVRIETIYLESEYDLTILPSAVNGEAHGDSQKVANEDLNTQHHEDLCANDNCGWEIV